MIMPKGLRLLAASFAPIALASAALLTATGTAAQSTPTPPPGCTGPASQTWLNVVAEGLKNGDGLLADAPSPVVVARLRRELGDDAAALDASTAPPAGVLGSP